MGDHSECIQVDFDPDRVTYEALLHEFWAMHSPASPSISVQYASMILTADEIQFAKAKASLLRLAESTGRHVYTTIRSLGEFYPAEHYHQKYALRSDRVLDEEMHLIYPDEVEFRESTASARVNGYLYGTGSARSLGDEISALGLSAAGERHLRSQMRR